MSDDSYLALNPGYDLTPNSHLIGNLIANTNHVGHFEKSKKDQKI